MRDKERKSGDVRRAGEQKLSWRTRGKGKKPRGEKNYPVSATLISRQWRNEMLMDVNFSCRVAGKKVAQQQVIRQTDIFLNRLAMFCFFFR